MKTKHCLLNDKKRFVLALLVLLIFFSCKKEDTFYSKLNSSTVNAIASDGIVTVQASILPEKLKP